MKVFLKFSRIIESFAFKTSFKDKYAIDEIDVLYQLIMLVLIFIYDENIKKDYTDKDRIRIFLSDVLDEIQDTKIKNKRLQNDNYDKELVDFITDDILRNGGAPIDPLKAYNFDSQKEVNLTVNYLETDPNNNNSLGLSKKGYELVFITYEIPTNIDFSIEQLILEYKIKKENFDEANSKLENIIFSIKSDIKAVEREIEAINKDAHALDGEIDKRCREINDTCIENRKKLKLPEMRDLVEKSMKEFQEYELYKEHKVEVDEKTLENKKRDSIKLINYINDSITLFQKLSENATDLLDAKGEALKRALNRGKRIERISFKKDIMDVVYNNPENILSIDEILAPIFMPKKHTYFPLESILDSHSYNEDSKESSNLLYDIEEVRAIEEEEREEQRIKQELEEQRIEKQENIIWILLNHAYKSGRKISIGEILEVLSEDDDFLIRENLELFKLILFDLAIVGKVKLHFKNAKTPVSEVLKDERFNEVESLETRYLNNEVSLLGVKNEDKIELRFTDIELSFNKSREESFDE